MAESESEMWTIDAVAEYLGYDIAHSADQALRRAGVRPVGREPGRSGKNLYRASDVRSAFPGRGNERT